MYKHYFYLHRRIGFWDVMFEKVSVSYDFKEFNGMTRITATKVVKGIPLHFEILLLIDTYSPKVGNF